MSDSTFPSDGDYNQLTKNGAWRRHLPFLELGNTSNYMLETIVEQEDVQDFSPITINRQATAADEVTDDSGGLGLYLIDESPLDAAMSARGIARVSRFWAPLWGTFHVPATYPMQLPDLRGLSYDPGTGAVTPTYDDNERSITLDPSGTAITSAGLASFTSGNWTYEGSANIAYNASDATILSTLQAEDFLFDSVTTEADGRVKIVYATSAEVGNPPVEPNADNFDLSGLTPGGAIARTVTTGSGSAPPGFANYDINLYLYPKKYEIESAGHGLTTGDFVFLRDGAGTIGRYEVTVVDTDNFTVVPDEELSSREATEFATGGFYYIRGKNVDCTVEHRFYMIGITPGIDTYEDIPAVHALNYDYGLFKAMVDETAEIIVAAGELQQIYPGVFMRQVTKIKIADIYD